VFGRPDAHIWAVQYFNTYIIWAAVENRKINVYIAVVYRRRRNTSRESLTKIKADPIIWFDNGGGLIIFIYILSFKGFFYALKRHPQSVLTRRKSCIKNIALIPSRYLQCLLIFMCMCIYIYIYKGWMAIHNHDQTIFFLKNPVIQNLIFKILYS